MTTRATDSLLTPLRDGNPAADDDTPDAILVGRLRKGDPKAAETLVLRYHRPLVGYLRRLTGQSQAAEELHQQTWLAVLQNVERFDPKAGAGFKAWLFRIATNKANDLWRRRRTEPTGDYGVDTAAAAAPPGGSVIEAAEEADRLRAAIAKLPEAQRQVLLMRYYGGLKFAEIAESLGCPLNTALGRMHKALIRLRVLMDDPTPTRTTPPVHARPATADLPLTPNP